MYKTVRRLVIVLVLCLASLPATTGLASAAPKLTPAQQTYAKCVADAGIKALKEIDKQTWKSKAAREAALKALIEKIKAACPSPPPPAKDVCPNIAGVQTTVPAGYSKDAKGNCVKIPPTPTDQCPNLTGVQETVPPGYQKDPNGTCVAVDQEFTTTLTQSGPGTRSVTMTCPAGTFDVFIGVTLSPNPPVAGDRVTASIFPTGPFGAIHTLRVVENPSGTTYTSTATLICGARDPGSQQEVNTGQQVGTV